jgi:hypothetical protein
VKRSTRAAALSGIVLAALVLRLAYQRRHPVLRTDGPQAVVDHLTRVHPVGASLVVDGSADEQIACLVAAGWTVDTQADFVGGKRIRYLHPPAEATNEQILKALRGYER